MPEIPCLSAHDARKNARRRQADRRIGWLAFVACIAALLLPRPALALDPSRALTQYVHRIWQMQQGLPEGTIYSIAQTANGFLWLGTQTGLVRFDGVQFTTVRDAGQISLENLWIRDLIRDEHNGLWLATEEAGLIHLSEGGARRFTTRDGLPSDRVRALMIDRNGTLWAAGPGGLATVVGDRVTRFGPEQGLNVRDPHDLFQAADGRIWVGGEGASLAIWNGKAFETRRLTSVPDNVMVRAIDGWSDGAIWVGTSQGLVRIGAKGDERRFTRADGLPADDIECLVAGGDGCVYVGTNNGFSRVCGNEVETFGTAQGLSQSAVYSLFYDREGSLWIGTKHGLNQLMDRRTLPFTASEGLASNDTGPVLQGEGGTIWVGTLDAGLSRFDGAHFTTIDAKQGLSSDTIYSLAADRDGALWVGTSRGLDHLRAGRVDAVYTATDGLPSDQVLSLQRDPSGVLWFGTSNGLATLADGRFARPQTSHGPLSGAIRSIGLYQRRIVVATASGDVLAFDGKLLVPLQEGLADRGIDAFYEDPDGALWMGSQGGGLRVLDRGKTFAYSIRDGLYDDDIFGIIGDRLGNLWMACSKGIFSVSRDDLKQFAAGRIKQLKCMPFSPLEALRTIECKPGVQPAACEASNGMAWFSTIRGVLALDTDHVIRKLLPAPVVIDDVVVNGRPLPPDQVKRLPPEDSNIEFRYTALSYVVPARITFRYRLDGFDRDWVDAGARREAFYTNLRPGNYTFRVMAHNVDDTWSESESPLAFSIAPHFYQRGWFLPLCIAALLWAAWMIYRLRVNRIRQRLDVILTERSRIARELHDTLMQGFSGITMEMQALSARLPDIPERRELNDIIGDAGTCLREARQSIAGLRAPQQDQGSSLAESIAQHARQMTEAKNVRLKLKLDGNPRGLPPAVEYNLLRIAQEAVTNSVKHANARTIEVCLDSTPQQLRLCVRDDGIGLKNGNGRPGHYGLIGMRERAAQIGADLRIESEAGRGTSVDVLVPTAGNHHAKHQNDRSEPT